MKTNKIIAATVLCLSTAGCYKVEDASKALSGASGSNSSLSNASISLKVKDSSGNVVFSSVAGGSSGFMAAAGKTYDINVSVANCGASDGSVTILNTWKPAAASTVFNLSGCSYSGKFTPPEPGDYNIAVKLMNNGVQIANASFVASAACANPTFTVNSLDSNAISVTGSNNIYTYNGAGVVAHANGQAPYLCAWDYTGVGIVDSAFGPCENPQANVFSSLVINRKVGLVVKDACNTSYSVSKSVVLSSTAPVAPEKVFITGQVSEGTGIAASDIRIKDATYRSENVGGYSDCQPNYSNGTFYIQCLHNYGRPSSKSFGMKLTVSGITGWDLRSNINGAISAANAHVTKVEYITDQAGDQSPQVSLEGSQCTSHLTAVVKNPVGKPCEDANNPGSHNEATVEVYGDYSCSPVANAAGSARINGTFDGLIKMVDQCIGGQGQGGGLPPISL